MKTIRAKLLLLIAALTIMALSAAPVSAIGGIDYDDPDEMTINGLRYELSDDGTAKLCGWTDDVPSTVEIPRKVGTGQGELAKEYRVVVGDYALNGCEGIQRLSFQDEITTIGREAFRDCRNLVYVSFPESIEYIGESAFMGCVKLGNFDLPEGLTEIEPFTFSGCTQINSVTITSNIREIKGGAFSGCTGLTDISIYPNDIRIGDCAFYNIRGGATIHFCGTQKQWDSAVCDTWAGDQEGQIAVHIPEKVITKASVLDEGWIDYTCVDGWSARVEIPMPAAYYLTGGPFKCTGKEVKPVVVIYDSDLKLIDPSNYDVICSNNINAGQADVRIVFKGDYYEGENSMFYTILKGDNKLSVKGKTASVKASTLKKKSVTLAVSKVLKFADKGAGAKAYAKKKGSKKITINKKTGKVTVKKGLKKGKYKVTVTVKAAGDENYEPSSVKKVTFTVKVK